MDFNTQTSYKIWALSKGIAAIAAMGGCATLWNYWQTKQPSWLMTGLSLNGIALAASKLDEDSALILSNRLSLSNLARNNSEYARMVQPLPVEGYQPFNWVELKDYPDKYPHLMLVGDTGRGKSTLVNNIAGLLQPALTVAVVPHWQAGDFESFNLIFGKGRNVGEGFNTDPCKTQPLYQWSDIEAGRYDPSACEVLHSLYWEMDRRYQHDADGKFVGGQPIVVALDEFLLYAQLPGVKSLWSKLVREARKVSIRLVLLVQGATVKSLDIEGEGDLRSNLKYVRLGQFATQYIDENIEKSRGTDKHQYWLWAKEQLRANEYSCTVDTRYGIAPPPDTWKLTKALPVATVQPVSIPSVESPSSLAVATMPQEYSPDEVAAMLCQSPETMDKYIKTLYDRAKDVAGTILENGQHPSRQWIIKHTWGFESKQYDLGCSIWKIVEAKYGKIIKVEA